MLASACTPDFDPVWLVKDLRILAIRADPPEVIGPASATAFPPIRIDALAVNPQDPAATYAWELWGCSAEKTNCDEAVYRTRLHQETSTLAQISRDVQISDELYQQALQADLFQGFGGVPLMVELKIFQGSGPTVRGVKRLVFGLEIPLGKTANVNPTLDEIRLDETPFASTVRVSDCEDRELLPVPSEAAREPYLVSTFSDPLQGEQLVEYLSYAFFASTGSLTHGETGGKPTVFVTEQKKIDVSSAWTPPCDDQGRLSAEDDRVQIWVVIRDDRGGVSWRELELEITP
jgi:hypothetical protein